MAFLAQSCILENFAAHNKAFRTKWVLTLPTNKKKFQLASRRFTYFRTKITSVASESAEIFSRDGHGYSNPLSGLDVGNKCGILYDTPQRGYCDILGANAVENGVNFALQSSTAFSVTLCLFTDEDLRMGVSSAEIPLNPLFNRTGNVWHILLPSLSPNLAYGYKVIPEPEEVESEIDTAANVLADLSAIPTEITANKAAVMAKEELPSKTYDAILLDPYAKSVIGREGYGNPGYEGNCWPQVAGLAPQHEDQDSFDWQGDSPPHLKKKDLVIYEIHVRGFTQHQSSGVDSPGTFLGLIEKLPHLKALGVNAIELMPIHEFNELEYYAYNPGSGDYRVNFWGYSTVNFFSPMSGYSSGGGWTAISEFKTLVRECHKMGIEVLLDVVFNHTCEGNDKGPTVSFRGLDNRVYYMVAPKGEYYNYSGCGNTLNCNHPTVRRFIVDCLKYWVEEMHVDGFRFDLASIMTRASSAWEEATVFGTAPNGAIDPTDAPIVMGTPLAAPPVIDMISRDPVLSSVKLIAEAWDAGGLYQVGNFPHYGLWAEWNGKFRDTVRQFIKGTDGMAGEFANSICGSPNLYQSGGRRPHHSVNFVTAHDGFTLMDLVSFNEKHNEANGEGNNDGENHNLSWNCGQEGEVVSRQVQILRQRQIRNFFLALVVSQGIPMFFMGDEYGHTKKGNNNTYCHDSEVNYFRWDYLESAKGRDFFQFCSKLLRLRSETDAFRLDDFPTSQNLTWHGLVPEQPDWSESSRFLAFSLRDSKKGEIYVAFNASHLPVFANLPERYGFKWKPLLDTSNLPPFDFLSEDVTEREAIFASMGGYFANNVYPMLSYSSIVLTLESDY